MKINSANLSLYRSRMLRQAKAKAVKSGGTSTSGLKSKHSSTLTGNSGSTSLISQMQEKNNYTFIRQTADNLQYYGEKLLQTGEKSLFAPAIKELEEQVKTETTEQTEEETTTNSLSEEEMASYKKNAIKEISNFIDAYNMMISRMSQSSDTSMDRYLKELKGYVTGSRSALSAIGISQNTDGSLKIDDEKLSKAELTKMYQAFGKEGSFAANVTALAKEIETTAETKLLSTQTSSSLPSYLTNNSSLLSSNYNRYGNYASALSGKNSGWYNIWS